MNFSAAQASDNLEINMNGNTYIFSGLKTVSCCPFYFLFFFLFSIVLYIVDMFVATSRDKREDWALVKHTHTHTHTHTHKGFTVDPAKAVSLLHITKTYLYNLDPLKPHFYIVKLGFTGVCIIFLISAQKHRLWYSLEPPRRGGSNECPQSMF